MELALAHLHSVLVHFALALFTVGFVVEVVGWGTRKRKLIYAGALLIVVGGLFGWATMYTGEPAEETLEGVLSPAAEAALDVHEEWGEWAGWLMLVAAAGRLGLFWWDENVVLVGSYLVYAGVVFLALLGTAYYGGKVTHAGHPHLNSRVATLGPLIGAERKISPPSTEESVRGTGTTQEEDDHD